MATRARKIADNVENLENVNNATVVITGNTAIIGVDINNNLEGKITDDLKEEIRKTAINTDKEVEKVSITADADLYTRIRNMSRDIQDGSPVSNFDDEIREILRRITPDM